MLFSLRNITYRVSINICRIVWMLTETSILLQNYIVLN